MVYVLEYVGATWCSTCKVIKPAAEELCKRYAIAIKEYDIDELTDEEKETITKVPTLTVKQDGSPVVSWNVNQVKSLTEWLQKNISLQTDDF
jgi:thiol-disulfide isomerase/thioredoxin